MFLAIPARVLLPEERWQNDGIVKSIQLLALKKEIPNTALFHQQESQKMRGVHLDLNFNEGDWTLM